MLVGIKINILLHRLTKYKQLNSTMKKLLTLVLVGGMLSFYACGPNKAELAKREAAKADSTRMADSLANVEMAAKAKATEDSIATANAAAEAAAKAKATEDSLAAASTKKGGKKVKTQMEKTKQEAKKATEGRG